MARRPVHHLVAFVKSPRLGRVKTRLATDVGAIAAWQFYRQTMTTVLRRLDGHGRWRRWLAVTPDTEVTAAGLWPPGWTRIAQGSGDLGGRMARVVRALPSGPVVIVGTDVPVLDANHVARAFRVLGQCDAVFGPAVDGGYWLVGLGNRRPQEIFRNVRWSTDFALSDTVANLGRRRVAMLEVLEDVDDGASWQRWRDRPRPSPATSGR